MVYHNAVKLNETDYTMWKFGVTLALEQTDSMGYVDETEAEPDNRQRNTIGKVYLSGSVTEWKQ